MKDLLGIAGGGLGLLAGCVTPAAVAVSAFAFGALGYVDALDDFWTLTVAEQTLLLALVAVVLGLVLYALQRPLYRVLEGYSWPGWAKTRGRTTQRERRAAFLRRQAGVEPRVAEERAALRWPYPEALTLPTRFGNRLRAFEVYGSSRFRLDSQTLWYELESLAPPGLRTELERARVPVDFCVSALFLSGLFGLATLLVALLQGADRALLLAEAGIALLLVPAWYAIAVASADEWGAAVKALVNGTRLRLAESLGLRMPATLAEEREMWTRVARFVRGIHTDEDIRVLDRFRDTVPRRPPPPDVEGAAYVLVDDGDTARFDLLLADGTLLARDADRETSREALRDVALLRDAAARAPVAEAGFAPRRE